MSIFDDHTGDILDGLRDPAWELPDYEPNGAANPKGDAAYWRARAEKAEAEAARLREDNRWIPLKEWRRPKAEEVDMRYGVDFLAVIRSPEEVRVEMVTFHPSHTYTLRDGRKHTCEAEFFSDRWWNLPVDGSPNIDGYCITHVRHVPPPPAGEEETE